MTLYKVKNKILSLCKIKIKDKASTPTDIDMYNKGYKYKFGDVTKWERIAYFKTEEAGKEYARSQGYVEW